ncbi:MAG: hypothetical protein ACRD7E_26150 [Bryobacteraceae bacterium]
MMEKLERLAAAGIQLLPAPEITTHYLLARDGFVVLIERKPDDGFGGIGAPGLLTERGLAPLVWRQDLPFFVTKDLELPAEPGQVEGIRRFQADLKQALS